MSRPRRHLQKIRGKMAKEQENKCHWCKKELTYEKGCSNTVTVDHVLPLWRGGGNERENLVAACISCNEMRARDDPPDHDHKYIKWLRDRGLLN